MAADLANRHAAGVHRDDLFVELRKAPLILGDQLRIEGPATIARDIQGDLRCPRQNRLLGIAIAVIVRPSSLFRIQVVVDLSLQDTLRKRLLQFIDKTVLGKQLLRIATRQQLIQ